MMKFTVLCCVFAAVAANVPYYVAPLITIPPYAVPLPYPYNTAQLPINNLAHGLHTLKKRSVTRLAVAPGPIGYSAALAAGNIGIIDPASFSAIATNPIGISSPLTTGVFGMTTPLIPAGISTPIAAGSLGYSTAVAAGSLGFSAPIVPGSAGISAPIAGISSAINTSPITFPNPIAISAPTNTGSATNTSPVAVGSAGVGSAVPSVGNI